MNRTWTKKDFRVDTFRGSGPGGQHRNKTDTAVRITHVATGLSAEAQDSRSQADNKKKAFRKLVHKLVAHFYPKKKECRVSKDVVRTYNECTDRIADTKTKKKYSYKATIGKGDMSKLIEDRARHVSNEIALKNG